MNGCAPLWYKNGYPNGRNILTEAHKFFVIFDSSNGDKRRKCDFVLHRLSKKWMSRVSDALAERKLVVQVSCLSIKDKQAIENKQADK